MWKSVDRKDSLAPLQLPTPPRNLNRSQITTASPSLAIPGKSIAFDASNVPQTASEAHSTTDSTNHNHESSLDGLNQQVQRLNERMRFTSNQHSFEVISFEKQIQEKDRNVRVLEDEKMSLQSEVLDLKRRLLAQDKLHQEHLISSDQTIKALQIQCQDVLMKYDSINQSYSRSTKDYNEKLDMTTSRILELETIMSLVKVETEERMQANARSIMEVTQDQIRFKDNVLQLSSKFEQYHQCFLRAQSNSSSSSATHNIDITSMKSIKDQLDGYLHQLTSIATQLESKIYDVLHVQQQPTIVSQETSDLFETINTLNNTIKSLKSKASMKVKKITDQYNELSTQYEGSKQQQVEEKHRWNVLQQEHQLLKSNLEALEHQHRSLQQSKDTIAQTLAQQQTQWQQQEHLWKEEKQSLQSKLDFQSQEVQRLQSYQKLVKQEAEIQSKQQQQQVVTDVKTTEEVKTLQMEMEVLQEEHKRKLQKRKKELKHVYEEHKQLREQYVSQQEVLQMQYEDLYGHVVVWQGEEETRRQSLRQQLLTDQAALERRGDDLRINYEIIQHQLQSELQQSRTAVQTAQQEKEALQQQVSQHVAIVDQRNKKIKTLMSKMLDFEQVCQQLRQVIQDQAQQLKDLQQRKVDQKSQNQQYLQAQATHIWEAWDGHVMQIKEDVEVKLSKQSKQITTLQDIVQQVQALLRQQQQQHVQEVDKAKRRHQQDMLKYEDTRASLQQAVQDKQDLVMKEALWKQREGEYMEMQGRSTTLSQQCKLLQEESQYLTQQIQQRTTQQEALQQSLDKLEIETKKKEEVNREQQEEIDELQTVLTSKQTKINEFHHQLLSSEGLNRMLTKKCEALEEEKLKLEEDMISKRFAFEQVQDQYQQSQLTLKILQDSLESGLLQEVEKLKTDRTQQKKAMEDLQQQFDEQRKDLQDHQQQVVSLQQERDELQKRVDEQEAHFSQSLLEAHREKQTLNHQINYSTTNYLQLKQEVSEYTSQLSTKDMEIDELQQRLMIYKQEYRKQEKEMANMMVMFQHEFSSLQSQLADITNITSMPSFANSSQVPASNMQYSPPKESMTSNVATPSSPVPNNLSPAPPVAVVPQATPEALPTPPLQQETTPMSPAAMSNTASVKPAVANDEAVVINDFDDSPLKTSKLSKDAIVKKIHQNKQQSGKLSRKETLKPKKLLEDEDDHKPLIPSTFSNNVEAEESIALAPSDFRKPKATSSNHKDHEDLNSLEDIINQATHTLVMNKAIPSGGVFMNADIRKIAKATTAEGNVVSTPKRKSTSSKAKRPTTPSRVFES